MYQQRRGKGETVLRSVVAKRPSISEFCLPLSLDTTILKAMRAIHDQSMCMETCTLRATAASAWRREPILMHARRVQSAINMVHCGHCVTHAMCCSHCCQTRGVKQRKSWRIVVKKYLQVAPSQFWCVDTDRAPTARAFLITAYGKERSSNVSHMLRSLAGLAQHVHF